jgi:glycosyltransferase involved in cell wall biosynthesis
MTIAAHFFSSKEQPSYLLQYFRILASENPGDSFIFFIDPLQVNPASLPLNSKVITVSPSLKNGLLLHYWYNFKLPAILKKYNVSCFVGEMPVCSLRTRVPQSFLISDLSILGKRAKGEFAAYTRRFFSKFVQTAAAVLVTEDHLIPKLAKMYPVITGKVSAVGYGLPAAYRYVEPEEHPGLLEEFAGGYEYFLVECSPATKDDLVAVVKAYSLFKKRLKSGLRLVILLRGIAAEDCIPGFKNYKYRHEVFFVSHQSTEKTALLFSGAYAFVSLSGDATRQNAGLAAMRSQVPVITKENPGAREIYRDAALFTEGDEKTIADKMMWLYKDENGRKELIQKGIRLSAHYNWQTTAGLLWQTILNIIRD